MPIWMIVGFAT